MKAQITITMDNAAFEGEEAGPELARILRNLADKVEAGLPVSSVRALDFNGNPVGSLNITD